MTRQTDLQTGRHRARPLPPARALPGRRPPGAGGPERGDRRRGLRQRRGLPDHRHADARRRLSGRARGLVPPAWSARPRSWSRSSPPSPAPRSVTRSAALTRDPARGRPRAAPPPRPGLNDHAAQHPPPPNLTPPPRSSCYCPCSPYQIPSTSIDFLVVPGPGQSVHRRGTGPRSSNLLSRQRLKARMRGRDEGPE